MGKSSYEELRLKNLEDNKKILAELGILNPFKPLPRVVKTSLKRKRDPTYVPERKKKQIIVNDGSDPDLLKDYGSENVLGRRRSSRVKGLAAPEIKDIEDEVERSFSEANEEEKARRKSLGNRPMIFGSIPGVEVGKWWAMRIHCNHDNVHRPTVAGIHAGLEGAYSIALSGGYEDDIDMGDCFTYTGEGGRDLKGTAAKPKNLRTAPQSRDQWLSRGNAGLVKSCELERPVRVIRGFKSDSPFAPEEGYRYDGLYKVEKYWYTTGLAGFGVYKFALRRLDDQAPPPWSIEDAENNNTNKIQIDRNLVSPSTEKPEGDQESITENQDSKTQSRSAECAQEDNKNQNSAVQSESTESALEDPTESQDSGFQSQTVDDAKEDISDAALSSLTTDSEKDHSLFDEVKQDKQEIVAADDEDNKENVQQNSSELED